MRILVRIVAPIIVILVSIGSLYFVNQLDGIKKGLRKDNADLTTELGSTRGKLDNTSAKLTNTEKELNKTVTEREQVKGELATTNDKLKASQDEVAKLNGSLTDLQGKLTAKDTEFVTAKADLTKAQAELEAEKAKVAAAQGAPEKVKELEGKVDALTKENKVVGEQVVALQAAKAKLEAEKLEWTVTPASVRGTIAAVQDNWGFVVLNIGEQQKVRKEAQFLVYRDSKLVCKVQVVNVMANNSIAEVLPEYQRSQPRVGDQVLR
jgi:uncharacterized protein (DUF3084 family)